MITVLAANLMRDFAPLINSHLKYLPESDIQKSRSFQRKRDADSFMLGRILIIKSLKEWKIQKTLGSIEYTEYKKPFFSGNFKFNISHSGKWVVCAATMDNEIGIDIEEILEIDINDFERLFSGEEWGHIKNDPISLRKFYEFWTIKEAVSKADGRGFHMDFKKIKIHISSGTPLVEGWNVRELKIDENVFCHLALERMTDDVKFINVFPNDV